MNTERERLNYYKYLKSQSAALNFFPANIAIIDNQGYIASVNEPWRDFGRKNNLRSMEFGVGSNYLDICDRAKGLWAEEASLCGVGIRSVISGESSEFFMEYSCDSPLEPRWFLRTDLSNNSKIAPAKYNGSYFADSRA